MHESRRAAATTERARELREASELVKCKLILCYKFSANLALGRPLLALGGLMSAFLEDARLGARTGSNLEASKPSAALVP